MAASDLISFDNFSPPELVDELSDSDENTIAGDYTKDYFSDQRLASLKPEPELIHYEPMPNSLQTDRILELIENSTSQADRPPIPPLRLSRPRTYAVNNNMMHAMTTLHYMTSAPHVPNPSITVLLALKIGRAHV